MNPIHKITGVLLTTAALSVLGAGVALARTPAGPPVPYSVSVTGPSGAHLHDDLSDLGNRLIEITPGRHAASSRSTSTARTFPAGRRSTTRPR